MNNIKLSEELRLQAKCFQWFWNNFPKERRMLHANDNNSYNGIEGARKKALGVVRGVSDMEYAGWGRVHFIEFKIPGGTQSDEQIEFQRMAEERGLDYHLVYTFEEFQLLMTTLIIQR